MLNVSGEHIYVAELKVPTCFYSTRERRYPLDPPTGFEVSRAYYIIRPWDGLSISGYAELALVCEFVSGDLKDAEEHALKVGRTFGSAASAFGGYPLEPPYLGKMARMGIENNLDSEHHYAYGVKPYTLSLFDYEGGHLFARYLESICSFDARTRYQLQSAIRWYGVCVSADDPAVSCVAAWTGLECIGTIIHKKAHLNGPKAYCQTCDNFPGKGRDRKEAGIAHMFNSLIKGPLSASITDEARQTLERDFGGRLSWEEAEGLRNLIVHGLEDIEVLVKRSSLSKRFLAHVLNASIQTILEDHIRSWIPGDYESHPNARYSLSFKKGLARSPYSGEWAAELRTKSQPEISRGEKPYMTAIDVEWIAHDSIIGFEKFKSEELFERDTNTYNLADDSEMTGLPNWYERPSEPPWKEWSGLICIDPEFGPSTQQEEGIKDNRRE